MVNGTREVRDAASMLQDEKSSLSARPELRNVNLRPRCSAFASCRLPAAGFLGRLACMEQKLQDTAADLESATQAQARRDLSQSCAALPPCFEIGPRDRSQRRGQLQAKMAAATQHAQQGSREGLKDTGWLVMAGRDALRSGSLMLSLCRLRRSEKPGGGAEAPSGASDF